MTGPELEEARLSFGMGRREFAELLGYTGSPQNYYKTLERYENGKRDIPPIVERLVLMLVWFKSDFGYLPNLDAGERMPAQQPAEFS